MARRGHNDLLDALGASIVSGDRPAGTVLTLAGLVQAQGVSRPVIREAVRVLENMGLVRSRPRVGVTVQPQSVWNALDPRLIRWQLAGPGRTAQFIALMELRAAIEPLAARLAAGRADERAKAELARLAARLRELGEAGGGSDAEYLAVDIAYHRLLLEASGNPLLASLRGVFSEVLGGRTALGLSPPNPDPGALDDHERTAAAMSSGDAEAAERHARAVVTQAWTEVVAAAQEPRGQDGSPAGPAR